MMREPQQWLTPDAGDWFLTENGQGFYENVAKMLDGLIIYRAGFGWLVTDL